MVAELDSLYQSHKQREHFCQRISTHVDGSQTTRRKGITGHAGAW